MMYSRVPPLKGSMSRWTGVVSPQRPNQHHKGFTLFSGVSSRHKGLAHFSTKGFLKAEPCLYIKLGALIHNLIGGSHNSHQSTTKPLSRLGFQEPKCNKLLTFTFTNLRGELKSMHQMKWLEQLWCKGHESPLGLCSPVALNGALYVICFSLFNFICVWASLLSGYASCIALF
jgi:hypothetical protein